MRRRAFIGLVGAAAAGWPFAAPAQQPTKSARIGLLITVPIDSPVFRETLDPFRQGLRDVGYVEGQNLVIEYRSADGKQERFPSLAMDLVRLNVDVIWAPGMPHARAALQATRTIPIVSSAMGDPVADGLVASLARPGGNITGLTNLSTELVPKVLELLKLALPSLTRIALLWDPNAYGAATINAMLDATMAAARSLGLQVHLARVDGADRLDSSFSAMLGERPEALLLAASSMFFSERRRIVELVTKHRLPAVFHAREYAELGGLMAYGTDIRDLFRRSGAYVGKILNGANPAELPIEQPTRFELVINLKAAKALGLAMPAALLSRADELIE